MNYTVIMLSYCKISDYKIKKILECFIEDYTSTEASKLMKLNRKTIDRYYKMFRRAFRPLIIDVTQSVSFSGSYIGSIKGEYGPKTYLNVYRVNKKFFLITKVIGKPISEDNPLLDDDFKEFRRYVHLRFSKFRGLTEETYYYQLTESSFKYAYSKKELFSLLWASLKEITKKNKDKWIYY